MLKPKPDSKTKIFPLFISSCIPSAVPANCHINFSSKPNNLYFIYIFFSLSKLPPHIHSLFIFTSSCCLFPSSFCCTVTPTSCYHLRFVLLSSQACVSCCRPKFIVSFLSIFSFTFFSPISLLPQDFTLKVWKIFSIHISARPERNYIQNIGPRRVGEAKKKDTPRTPVICQKWRVGATIFICIACKCRTCPPYFKF